MRARDLVECDEGCGHHVVGQALFEGSAEVGGAWCAGVGGDDVGDELFVTGGGFACDGSCGFESGMGEQHAFDFAGFDAKAAYFDLLVGAAEVFDCAGVGPAGQVAGAVHAAAGRPEGAGDEVLGGQPGAVQVAAG